MSDAIQAAREAVQAQPAGVPTSRQALAGDALRIELDQLAQPMRVSEKGSPAASESDEESYQPHGSPDSMAHIARLERAQPGGSSAAPTPRSTLARLCPSEAPGAVLYITLRAIRPQGDLDAAHHQQRTPGSPTIRQLRVYADVIAQFFPAEADRMSPEVILRTAGAGAGGAQAIRAALAMYNDSRDIVFDANRLSFTM